MSAERTVSVPRIHRQRRSVGEKLREAIGALADGKGRIEAHQEKSWASITFAGTRHRIELVFADGDAIAAGEALIASLSEHEFAIPGQLVADANIVSVDHRLSPSPELRVICELLLLEDA